MPIDDFIPVQTEYADPPELILNYDGMFDEVFEEIFGRLPSVEDSQ